MSSTHLVIPDIHCRPEQNNDRADLLAKLISDVNPDVVINMGDQGDFPSLSSYDKGKRSFVGRTYAADINSFLEFQERVWGPVKQRKKKMPYRVFLEGNHEHRIEKALDLSPELTNTISFDDLQTREYYNDVVRYDGLTPGQISVDGIMYAHYFVAGVSGRPLSGEHHAYQLLAKQYTSCTASHSHLTDYAIRTVANGKKIHGLVAGCFLDYSLDWAGETNKLWWKGVVLKHNVEDGNYDPEFISLARLQKEYG